MKSVMCLVLSFFLLSAFNVGAVATSARAAAVINGDTGEIIYTENGDARLPMASTTKIMTALLLCENGDLKKEITVTADMLRVEGSSMGLLAGDRVTYHDLLYGMMLASGNDAANAAAISLGGSLEGFVGMMNKRAEALGLNNTHFATPSGLDATDHYTTAKELASLAAFALKNEAFAKAAAAKSATLCYGNPPYKRTLTNHNKMLGLFDGAVGVKTGFTKKSGRCLVSAARRDGKLAVAVTLNDPNDWEDHISLLNYGLNSIKTTNFSPITNGYMIPVIGSSTEKIEVFIEPYTVNTLEAEKLSCVIRLPKFLYAPIEKGETLGTVEYKFADTVIDTVDLRASRDIPVYTSSPDFITELTENIKHILAGILEL